MTFTLNTAPTPTQGFSGNYTNETGSIGPSYTYMTYPLYMTRLPDGNYLLHCIANFTTTSLVSGPWWNICESLNAWDSSITSGTFKKNYVLGKALTYPDNTLVDLEVAYNANGNTEIAIYSPSTNPFNWQLFFTLLLT